MRLPLDLQLTMAMMTPTLTKMRMNVVQKLKMNLALLNKTESRKFSTMTLVIKTQVAKNLAARPLIRAAKVSHRMPIRPRLAK